MNTEPMSDKQQLLQLQQDLIEVLPDEADVSLDVSPSGKGFDISIAYKRSTLVCEITFVNNRVRIEYLGDMIGLPAALAFKDQVGIIQRRLGLPRTKW